MAIPFPTRCKGSFPLKRVLHIDKGIRLLRRMPDSEGCRSSATFGVCMSNCLRTPERLHPLSSRWWRRPERYGHHVLIDKPEHVAARMQGEGRRRAVFCFVGRWSGPARRKSPGSLIRESWVRIPLIRRVVPASLFGLGGRLSPRWVPLLHLCWPLFSGRHVNIRVLASNSNPSDAHQGPACANSGSAWRPQ